MEKKEAAEFLGVSVRTIERLAADGKLTKGRARKKTRPVVVFDKQELERLKAHIHTARPEEVFRRLNTPKPQDAIGFRLDPSYVKRLAAEGEKLGMSPSEYARKLVVRGLEDDGADRVSRELRGLRQNLTDMFYLVLTTKLGASDDEAAEIVRTLAAGSS